MVQADTAFGYDDGVPDDQTPSQPIAFRESVAGFVEALAAVGTQMADAVDSFAAAAAAAVSQAEQRAGSAAVTSAEMADASHSAAAQAREAAEQALAQAESLKQAVEAYRADVGARADAAATAGEQAASRAQEAAIRAEEAAGRAHSAASSTSESSREVLRAAEGVAANAAAAQEAAVSARESALAAVPGPSTAAVSDATDLLERLETDYQLLTRLVQELHLRVGSLAGTSTPAPAHTGAAAEAGASHHVYQPAVDTAPNAAPVAQPRRLSGSILLTIAPVSDFDSLLKLDSALSGIEGVTRVNFADYVQQEVTFRIELAQSVDAGSLVQRLNQAASARAEIEAVGEASLSLRMQ